MTNNSDRLPLHRFVKITCPDCGYATSLDHLNVGEPRCGGCRCFLVPQFGDNVLFVLRDQLPRTEATTVKLRALSQDVITKRLHKCPSCSYVVKMDPNSVPLRICPSCGHDGAMLLPQVGQPPRSKDRGLQLR